MKQIIKKDKLILKGTPKEITNQLALLCLKFKTLKELLDFYHS